MPSWTDAQGIETSTFATPEGSGMPGVEHRQRAREAMRILREAELPITAVNFNKEIRRIVDGEKSKNGS